MILSWHMSTIICADARSFVAIAWSDAALAKSASSLRRAATHELATLANSWPCLRIMRCWGFCFSRGVAAAMASAFV